MQTGLPESLVEIRERAREKLKLHLKHQFGRAWGGQEISWQDLLQAVRDSLPSALLPYLDERDTHTSFSPDETWVTFRLPDCWPVRTYFTRFAGIWLLKPAGIRSIDHPTNSPLYAVELHTSTEWEQTIYTHTLGAALVVAQKESAKGDQP